MLGSDGLWKSFKNQEVVDHISSIVHENGTPLKRYYENCCNNIANTAVKKLTADNVTCLILSIQFED